MNEPAPVQGHNAIVVGGGIGGLTAALCLLKAGHRPLVLERADEIREVGAGIQLSPNACRVLDAIGVLESIRAMAFEPLSLEMREGISGRRIFSIDAGNDGVSHWHAPYLHVHRADLVAVLGDALSARAPGSLVTNAKVTGLVQRDDDASVTLEDGRKFAAEFVIGADGIHSAVRDSLFGPAAAVFTGNVAWRATVDLSQLGEHAPPPTACVWAGAGRHAVTYRLRGGTLANIVGVVEQRDWHSESWNEPGERSLAIADFAGWHPVVTTLMEAAPRHYRWALFDRPPLERWHNQRVVLLGDACHPMLPFLAQGAAMAIEDAWVLAAMLDGGDPDRAFRRYTDARLPRVSRVYKGARKNQRTFHLSNRLAQRAVYAGMRLGGNVLPGVVRSRLDWLYGEDVTASHPLRTG